MSSEQAVVEAVVDSPPEEPADIAGTDRRLEGAALIWARGLWWALAAFASMVFVAKTAAAVRWYAHPPPATIVTMERLGVGPGWVAAYVATVETACAAVFFGVALALVKRGAGRVAALLAATTFIGFGPLGATAAMLGTLAPDWKVPALLLEGIARAALVTLAFVFPDGRFVPRWTRWLAASWVIVFLPYLLPADVPISAINWPPALSLLVQVLFTANVAYAQIYRYRRVSGPEQRRRTRWAAFGAPVTLALTILIQLPWYLFPQLQDPGPVRLLYILARIGALSLSLMVAPVTFGIAILRHRLYDIDIIINRALVYGLLTALMAGLFATVISLAQRTFIALTGETSLGATLLATLMVVSVITPVRNRLQEWVDNRFKGAPEPVRRLQQLTEAVRARVTPLEPETAARRLLDLAVTAYGAEGGVALLQHARQSRLVHTGRGWSGGAAIEVPLAVGEETYGSLALGRRKGGSRYRKEDRTALEAAARVIAEALQQDAADQLVAAFPPPGRIGPSPTEDRGHRTGGPISAPATWSARRAAEPAATPGGSPSPEGGRSRRRPPPG